MVENIRSLPENVVMEAVIAGQRDQPSASYRHGEEDLIGRVLPHLEMSQPSHCVFMKARTNEEPHKSTNHSLIYPRSPLYFVLYSGGKKNWT